jgi:hypothetical protein
MDNQTPVVIRPAVAGAGGGRPDVVFVDICATGPLALTGLQTIDGVAVGADWWVFCPFQAAPADRGIWIAKSTGWKRGATPYGVIVSQGTKYGGATFIMKDSLPTYRAGRGYYS